MMFPFEEGVIVMVQDQGLKRPQPDAPCPGRRRLWQYLRWALLLLAVWGIGDIAYGLVTLPPLPSGAFDPSRPSMVYAANGTQIGPLSGDIFRVPAGLKQMPDYLPKAFVASEDIRFYAHGAIDPRGILRALITDLRSGSIQEGGSTITQQVAKNTFLTAHQTLRRKAQEAVLALELEHRYGKDEILGMYLNEIYMGNGAYGVGAAAKLYFNKEAADLTLGEAATLAGINPAPESYNPLRHLDIAQRQRNIVLDRMVSAGLLDGARAEQEKARPLKLHPGKPDLKDPYPWYMDAVRRELKERYDLDERAVDLMGLSIHTALDPTLQGGAESALSAKVFPGNAPDGLEGAFVAVDPRSGEIRAMVGGRDYAEDGGLNRAMDARVLPGSVFKPVMVYGPAFEYAGLTADSKIKDEPLDIGGWKPEDYDHQFRGQVTMREAARNSLNIPAINMLQMVGVDKAKAFAANLGIPFAKDDKGLMLALGSMSRGLAPLSIAAAYQPFANGGTYYEPHVIVKVEAADGGLSPRPLKSRKAMRPGTAHAVTDILQTVIKSGTGTTADLGRPMAGKTGTVELPDTAEFKGKQGNTAAWFVGYTPDLIGAVWLGYDQTDAGHYLPAEVNGSTYPPRIWRQAVGPYLAERPALAFPGPDGRAPAPPPARAPAPEPPKTPAAPPEQPKPQPAPLPDVSPLYVKSGVVPGTAELTWVVETPAAQPQQKVTYLVLRGTVPDMPMDPASALTTVTGGSFVDMPPKPGTYYYRVVSYDPASKQMGNPSAAVSVVIEAPGAPGAPPPDQPKPDQPKPDQPKPPAQPPTQPTPTQPPSQTTPPPPSGGTAP
jgi:1A family penicillin-binding protein